MVWDHFWLQSSDYLNHQWAMKWLDTFLAASAQEMFFFFSIDLFCLWNSENIFIKPNKFCHNDNFWSACGWKFKRLKNNPQTQKNIWSPRSCCQCITLHQNNCLSNLQVLGHYTVPVLKNCKKCHHAKFCQEKSWWKTFSRKIVKSTTKQNFAKKKFHCAIIFLGSALMASLLEVIGVKNGRPAAEGRQRIIQIWTQRQRQIQRQGQRQTG